MPDIEDILSLHYCERLYNELDPVKIEQFNSSLCHTRDVSRVPLKMDGLSEDEDLFLSSSHDGLQYFEPYDIHSSNVQSRDGLFKILKAVQVVLVC